MLFTANLEEILKFLKGKQQASTEPITCEITRYYSVEEYRGKEQGDIVFGDLESFHKLFNRFPGAEFILRLVVGDSAQIFRHQARGLSPEAAYELSLMNGAEFINWMRPAVLYLLKNPDKKYFLSIVVTMWDQELLANFPSGCLPPIFDPEESDEEFKKKHDLWYKPYIERNYSHLLDEDRLSEKFKWSRDFVRNWCKAQDDTIGEKLRKAAIKYIAEHEYTVPSNIAQSLSVNLFQHEIAVFSSANSEVLSYGINATSVTRTSGFITKTLIEVTQGIWRAQNNFHSRFFLFSFHLNKKAQYERYLANLQAASLPLPLALPLAFSVEKIPPRKSFQRNARKKSTIPNDNNSRLSKTTFSNSAPTLFGLRNSQIQSRTTWPTSDEKKREVLDRIAREQEETLEEISAMQCDPPEIVSEQAPSELKPLLSNSDQEKLKRLKIEKSEYKIKALKAKTEYYETARKIIEKRQKLDESNISEKSEKNPEDDEKSNPEYSFS